MYSLPRDFVCKGAVPLISTRFCNLHRWVKLHSVHTFHSFIIRFLISFITRIRMEIRCPPIFKRSSIRHLCSHNKTLASKGKICRENLMVYPNLSTKCLIYFRKHLDTVKWYMFFFKHTIQFFDINGKQCLSISSWVGLSIHRTHFRCSHVLRSFFFFKLCLQSLICCLVYSAFLVILYLHFYLILIYHVEY